MDELQQKVTRNPRPDRQKEGAKLLEYMIHFTQKMEQLTCLFDGSWDCILEIEQVVKMEGEKGEEKEEDK